MFLLIHTVDVNWHMSCKCCIQYELKTKWTNIIGKIGIIEMTSDQLKLLYSRFFINFFPTKYKHIRI